MGVPVRRPDAEPMRATPAAPDSHAATASSTEALPANDQRVFLSITNEAAQTCYLGFGATAVVGSGIAIQAGGTMFLDRGVIFTQAVNAILTSGTGNLSIQEGT